MFDKPLLKTLSTELLKISVVSSFTSFIKDIRSLRFKSRVVFILSSFSYLGLLSILLRPQFIVTSRRELCFTEDYNFLSTRVDYIQLHSSTFDSNGIYLISLSPDISYEVSLTVMSFQIKLYLLITWVRNSGLIQDYRIFEDMHDGITINREFLKTNLYLHFGFVVF